MALCTLLMKHRQNEGWPQSVFAYTIDHGVRPESSEEAKTVGELVTPLGIPDFKILLTEGFNHRIVKLSSNMQAELSKELPGNLETVLRTERFDLLSDAAKDDSLGTLLTAHHQDDQYETVLQRLAWGSTLSGLGGIPPRNGRFRRPLLDYAKVVSC
jgi:tRNA(Ile)-lysidine synthase